MRSVESVIAHSIRYDHDPTAGARHIINALRAAGYSIVHAGADDMPTLAEYREMTRNLERLPETTRTFAA